MGRFPLMGSDGWLGFYVSYHYVDVRSSAPPDQPSRSGRTVVGSLCTGKFQQSKKITRESSLFMSIHQPLHAKGVSQFSTWGNHGCDAVRSWLKLMAGVMRVVWKISQKGFVRKW